MQHLAHTTQQRPRAWAIYSPAKAILERVEAQAFAPWANDTGPTDDEINTMAEWYSARQFGAFTIESDAFDKEIGHA